MMTYTKKIAAKDKLMKVRCATCGDRAAWGRHPQCKRVRNCLVVQ
jgi:endogenous inhibitor of DNA gyrase (YacG/DUF329 family)